MATEDPQPPQNAKSAVEETAYDDELDPTPGESYTGRILNITPQETDYGESAVLTLELEDEDRVVDYFCRSEAKRAYKQGNLERGQKIWLGVQTEVQEVNGTEYNPHELYILDD
jgi:hypothetical protein